MNVFRVWFLDKYENEPGFEDYDWDIVAERAWDAATKRAARIAEKFADDLKLKSPAYGTAKLIAQKIRGEE